MYLQTDIEDYLTEDYIKAHIRQFKNGVSKFQKFKPNETWQWDCWRQKMGTTVLAQPLTLNIIEKVANGVIDYLKSY